MKLHENKNEARCTERGAWRDFAKGFIITLAVLLPVYLCVMVWAAGKNTETEQQEDAQAAASLQQNAALPPKAYNLHLILQDESGALVGSMLVRFDTPQQTAQLTLLPAETVLLYAKRTVPAAELYTQLGALALQQAVEETLGTAVSGWCCVEAAALTEFAQRCGELSLALPQGRLSLTAEQLNTQLDTVQTPAARAQLLQSAAAAILETLPADTLQEDILLWFQNEPPLRGNIDAAGIHALARAAAACCGTPAYTVADVYLQGSWNEQEQFVLADGSDRALQKYFGKAQQSN